MHRTLGSLYVAGDVTAVFSGCRGMRRDALGESPPAHAHSADSNTIEGTAVPIKTYNCVIVGDPKRVIATVGVSDLIIIQDGDCILVADRKSEASIKALVEELRRRGLEKYL